MAHRDDPYGVECPVCDQLVKVYKRKLNSSMSLVLISLARLARLAGRRDFIHVPSFINTLPLTPAVKAAVRGDWAKLQFWGFLMPLAAEREDGSKRTGMYQITAEGVQFAFGHTRVPAYVLITNQNVLGVAKETVDVHQALGKAFRYDELMTDA